MKPSLRRNTFILIALLLLISFAGNATHLRAGEITVRRDACNSLKFWITVTVFTNTINTNVLFGGEDDILDFGDGSDPDGDGIPGILVPETQNTIRNDLGEGIATASFTIDHVYSAASTYLISYSEPNRNEGVVNMSESVNTRFYIETEISIDPFLGCNAHTPVLAVPPIDRGCTGVAWFHNPGAFDLDGDSLSYRLVIPNRDRDLTVAGYRDPNASGFYTNFGTGNETADGPPVFLIDPIYGTITWNAPGAAGEYNIAFEILEWRKVGGEWARIGFVRRDMQIIIEECENNRPDLIIPADTCVVAGTVLNAIITGIDEDFDKVKIEAFSEIFGLSEAESPATYSPVPDFRDVPSVLNFQWQTECLHVKDQPYQVVFKITDDGQPKLVTFKTWLITVVGPPPEWESATPVVSDRTVNLEWDEYYCDNANVMQVWRRVDSLAFEPDVCQTGMPPNLGYELISEVDLRDASGNAVTGYHDTNGGQGLDPGAVYCYRLVALFPVPRGGESYMSEEICIPPFEATEPIITNVTVDRTGQDNGQITVKWVPPFEVDPAQFPGPFTYRVYRAEGFSGKTNLVQLPNPDPAATSFVDAGLNTQDKIYNYRIVGVAANENKTDTSAVASSVRLEAQSQLNRIQLTWSADVPWSNTVSGAPHRLYRLGPTATDLPTTPDQLTLLAEVDVLGGGFTYVDEGQSDGVPLEPGTTYCYVVETFGAYGNENPVLKNLEPFRNFSQIVCTQPGDSIPPCMPLPPVAHEPVNCDEYVNDRLTCNNSLQINNTLKWTRPDEAECGNDVAYYKIYVSPSPDGTFYALEDQNQNVIQVKDTFYVHRNLPSFAGCYKISAVDRSGNESELSESICFDNCPYYELPNVLTPNGDCKNDVFSAYSDRVFGGESGARPECQIPDEKIPKCARFVKSVTFKVYNRWGKEVYSYQSGGNNTIYIDWDGRSSDGQDLSSGTYYYVAYVTFDMAEPSRRNQTIKGWVQLVRGTSPDPN